MKGIVRKFRINLPGQSGLNDRGPTANVRYTKRTYYGPVIVRLWIGGTTFAACETEGIDDFQLVEFQPRPLLVSRKMLVRKLS